MDKKDIYKDLYNRLDGRRFMHTLGVAHTAACLAMSLGLDTDKAYMAGLLHDCAKYMSDKEYLTYCHKHDIDVSDIEKENPALLHSKVGADLAHERYDIEDEEILNAIRWHTTGHPGMTVLEEIIFTADYIEPNRTHDPELMDIRQEAFTDIKKAICHIYGNTMKHLTRSSKALDPMTAEAFEYYGNLI